MPKTGPRGLAVEIIWTLCIYSMYLSVNKYFYCFQIGEKLKFLTVWRNIKKLNLLAKADIRIFVTDDDDDDRNFVVNGFKESGYDIQHFFFSNGHFLINYFLKEHIPLLPDGIFLDLNMPMKDGYQTLKELKELHLVKDIPVFVLTSSTNELDAQKCYKLGCDRFYSKPMSVPDYNDIASDMIKCISEKSNLIF